MKIPLSWYRCIRCRFRFSNDLNRAASGMVHCPKCGHNYSEWINAKIVLAYIHANDPDFAAYRSD